MSRGRKVETDEKPDKDGLETALFGNGGDIEIEIEIELAVVGMDGWDWVGEVSDVEETARKLMSLRMSQTGRDGRRKKEDGRGKKE